MEIARKLPANRRTGAKGGPWLYGAALLNDPFYDSMPRVAASAAEAAAPAPPSTSEDLGEVLLLPTAADDDGRAPSAMPVSMSGRLSMREKTRSAAAAARVNCVKTDCSA